jgi:hypothetical protein
MGDPIPSSVGDRRSGAWNRDMISVDYSEFCHKNGVCS